MKTSKKNAYKFILFMAPFIVGSQAMAADTLKDNAVVTDKNGTPVKVMSDGTCVRTNDEAGFNKCSTTKIVNILSSAERNVFFEFDKATLTPEAKMQLTRVSKKLKDAKHVRNATILGYADHIGGTEYNTKLSRERAKTVRDYLASQGYFNTRVATLRGMGESLKKADQCEGKGFDDKVKCLQDDRRVEIRVDYTKEQYVSLEK